MSSGDFVVVKIEDTQDPTIVYKGLVQPETAAATVGGVANMEAAMDATEHVSAWVGKSSRTPGFRPAFAYFKWQGDGPADYTGDGGKIVLLTQAAFKAASMMGAELTYLGKMANITKAVPSLTT